MTNLYFETPANALEHYGIKGMKWGVRKKTSSTGANSKKPFYKDKRKMAAVGATAIAGGLITYKILAKQPIMLSDISRVAKPAASYILKDAKTMSTQINKIPAVDHKLFSSFIPGYEEPKKKRSALSTFAPGL